MQQDDVSSLTFTIYKVRIEKSLLLSVKLIRARSTFFSIFIQILKNLLVISHIGTIDSRPHLKSLDNQNEKESLGS